MEGFYVRYRALSPPTHHFSTAVVSSGRSTQYTVHKLRAYTDYELFVVPFNAGVHGHPSNSRVARTLEDGEISLFKLLRFFDGYSENGRICGSYSVTCALMLRLCCRQFIC